MDINKITLLLTPPFLRQRRHIAFLRMCNTGLMDIYDNFLTKRKDDLYRLSLSGQVCYLTKALNDKFDPELRRIKITDGSSYKRLYIYTRAEDIRRYLADRTQDKSGLVPNIEYVLYLNERSDYADTGVDFVVLIPIDVLSKHAKEIGSKVRYFDIEALIDFYKLASKRYKITVL